LAPGDPAEERVSFRSRRAWRDINCARVTGTPSHENIAKENSMRLSPAFSPGHKREASLRWEWVILSFVRANLFQWRKSAGSSRHLIYFKRCHTYRRGKRGVENLQGGGCAMLVNARWANGRFKERGFGELHSSLPLAPEGGKGGKRDFS